MYGSEGNNQTPSVALDPNRSLLVVSKFQFQLLFVLLKRGNQEKSSRSAKKKNKCNHSSRTTIVHLLDRRLPTSIGNEMILRAVFLELACRPFIKSRVIHATQLVWAD